MLLYINFSVKIKGHIAKSQIKYVDYASQTRLLTEALEVMLNTYLGIKELRTIILDHHVKEIIDRGG